MKKSKTTLLLGALVAVAFVVTACNKAGSGPAAGASPTETAKAFYNAAKSKDVPGMKNALSKKTLEMMERGAQAENKSVDEYIKQANDEDPPPATFEARNEKINGDTATVEVSNGKGGWQQFSF